VEGSYSAKMWCRKFHKINEWMMTWKSSKELKMLILLSPHPYDISRSNDFKDL